MSPTKPLSWNTGLSPQDGDSRTSVAMCTCTRVGHNEYLRKTCRTDRCVPRKQAIVSSRGQSTTVIARSAYECLIRWCQVSKNVTPIPNRTMEAFELFGYRIDSMCVAKVFDVCCQTIRSALQNHSMRVAKPFDPRCKTIRSALQNRSVRVSKPFDPRCTTTRSALQNHSNHVAKPFDS